MNEILSKLSDWLIWNRSTILRGELWRLLTAAFVHLSWQHFLANAVGAFLWWHLEGYATHPLSRMQRLVAALCGAVAVHTALLLATSYDWYAGASATLYGLLTFTALRSGWHGLLLLAALLVWLVLGSKFVAYSFPVALEAHWVGMVAGALGAAVSYSHIRRKALHISGRYGGPK